ncbi:MAG: type III pantothenate kinase [Methylococcales bacterium]|nr:type III pantothenate kinase [Methylococcales bacterium]
MNLLIDIGNTRIKWCINNNRIVNGVQAIDYKKNNFIKKLQISWIQLVTPPQVIAISSVSAHQVSLQIIELAKKNWPEIKVVMAKSSFQALSVTNAYSQPEKLGVDRWLGLIALQFYYPGNSCIVDCGTAITIDFLDEKGLHLGGLISPGLQLMKRSLSFGTEDLSYIGQSHSVGLSNATESAIFSGTLYAAAGLIEKTIGNICMSNTLVLTGGDAKLLANTINLKSIIEPDFVLKGLSLYCEGEKQA